MHTRQLSYLNFQVHYITLSQPGETEYAQPLTLPCLKKFRDYVPDIGFNLKTHRAAKQQISWVIAPWWIFISFL